ncbi:MAG: permease prefix domain 1-containing protein [Verrucomicrobiota bacterium]|jgi:hypothetical protein
MFNLEQAIADWRQQMLAAGIQSPTPLEELEGHLRETIEQLMKSGLKEPEAFEISMREIGQPKTLKCEFQKNERTFMKRTIGIGMGMASLLLGIALTIPAIVQLRRELRVADWRLGLMLLGMFLASRGVVSFQRMIQARMPQGEFEKVGMAWRGQTIKTGVGIISLLIGTVFILPAIGQACRKGMVEFDAICWLMFGIAMLIVGAFVTFCPYKKRRA